LGIGVTAAHSERNSNSPLNRFEIKN